MALWGDIATFVLWAAQQCGVLLGVGAESVLLVLYLAHINKPEHPAHSRVRLAQYVGLAIIVFSGAGVTALYWGGSHFSIVFAPAFIFKWILVLLLVPAAWFEIEKSAAGWGRHALRGMAGALWYAMFLVHTIAPVTTWTLLLGAFAAWVAIFMSVWMGCVYLLHRASMPKKIQKPEAQQKPAAVHLGSSQRDLHQVFVAPVPVPVAVAHRGPSPAPIKPASLPVVAHLEIEAPHKMPTPAPAPVHHEAASAPLRSHTPDAAPHAPAKITVPLEDLPRIRVMPRSPEDLKTILNRA